MESINFAKVKFIEDGIEDTIPIQNIKQFKDNPPTDKNDFNKNAEYDAFYRDPNNPTEDGYYKARIKSLISMIS